MFRRMAGLDSALWLSVIALAAIGCVVLSTSISDASGPTSFYGNRQIAFVAVGLVIAVVASHINLERVEQHWKTVYLACVGSIGMVMLLGTAIRGSRAWIELGPVNLQPSEMGKVLVTLAAAGYVVPRLRDLHRGREVLKMLAVVGLPGLLVLAQPDLGTALVYVVIAFALAYFAGVRWLHLGAMAGALVMVAVLVLGVLPAADVHLLKPYQVERLTGFLDPESDVQGTNYNVIQSKIAIGSGKMWGKPASEASQAREQFLPESHTDFIFATLVEQWGFVGGAVVIGLLALVVSRCLAGVAVAPTAFGRLVCGCIAAMFGFQMLENIGMSVGLMPITGIPLPFVSYGGSAMMANMLAVGVVSSVLRSSESAQVRYARRTASSLGAQVMHRRSARRRPAGGARPTL